MAKVIIKPRGRYKLNKLIHILVKKGFFGFYDSAENYVNSIYDFIDVILEKRKRTTKNPKNGKWFCRYDANMKTSWFISFDIENDVYLVKNITNNHTSEYPDFIIGTK